MYFAFDNHDSVRFRAQLRDAFNAFNTADKSGAGSYLFALVDTAFDHGQKQLKWTGQSTSVYVENSRLEGLGEVTPKLLALSEPSSDAFVSEVRILSYHCNGRPMLSFLRSKVDAAVLVQQWQKCLMLTTPNDQEPYLVRLADTRITPSLASMPQTTLWKALTAPVDQWLLVGRQGELQTLDPLTMSTFPNDAAAQDDGDIEISDADISHLLACGLPDSVINAINENFTAMLPAQNRSEFYQQVAHACQAAQDFNIEAFPDVMALAMAHHLANGELLKNPALQARLKLHDWADGTLSNLLGDYMPAEVQ